MSPTKSEERTTEMALIEEFRAAIDDARARIAAVLEPACPTPAFLAALRDEVGRAVGEPDAVPYPELADPDTYWDATVKPQARDTRDTVATIVEWLEERIITTMEVAESDLKALVDAAAAESVPDPVVHRAQLAAEVEERCLALHHQMAEVMRILPDDGCFDRARSDADDAVRAKATADVESLKEAYLRDAGGDETHQQFAEQQWSETFAERVRHRETMLAGEVPWRHQEFALVGYDRARAECARLVEEATERLQAPLPDLRVLLIERFDETVGAVAAS